MKRYFVSALVWALSARALAQAPIHIDMHVIGFGVDAATEAQLRAIANAGNGRYYNAANEAELESALGQAVGVPGQGAPFAQSNESEPNDSFGKANTIAASGAVTGTISPLRDHDWYRFRIDRPGVLELRLGGPAKLDLAVRLWGPDANDLSGWRAAAGAGAANEAIFGLLESGAYTLEIADGSDDAESTQAYTLALQYQQGDAFEPNNHAGAASRIGASQELQASINPGRDHDWYAVTVDKQGALDILIKAVPKNLDIAFRLWSPDLKDLTGWKAAPREGGDNQGQLDLAEPGTYLLELADGNDDKFSPDPYTLRIGYQAGDAFEPNNTWSQATPVTLGQDVQASILPLREHDWYTFTVDRQGTLELLITNTPANLDVAFRLYNADGRDLTGWRGARREGGDNDAVLALTEPGRYVLELADGNDNASSKDSYTLKTRFHAGDDYEPNPSFGKARDIVVGQDTKASINPDRDHDWYRFAVAHPGKLKLLITDSPDSLDIAFRLLDPDGRDLTGWRAARRQGGDNDAILDLVAAGSYTLELADANDDASSAQLYTLRLEMAP